MRRPTLKWLVCLAIVLVALFVGAIIWEGHHLPDIRSEASRADVIAYGRLTWVDGRSRIVIEEIWRHSPSGDPVSIGLSYPSKMPAAAHPDAAVVFLSHDGSPFHIIAVYGDQVPAAKMSLPDFKALCAGSPST